MHASIHVSKPIDEIDRAIIELMSKVMSLRRRDTMRMQAVTDQRWNSNFGVGRTSTAV